MSENNERSFLSHLLRGLLLVWAIALIASWSWQWLATTKQAADTAATNKPGEQRLTLKEVTAAGQLSGGTVQLAWLESGDPDAPTVVLIHGSPGHKEHFDKLIPLLDKQYHVIALDLPGFGQSQRNILDYSLRSDARYLDQLLAAKGVHQAHIVGYSLGGGVALQTWGLFPERVKSVTLLSAIGVQELELLGDYRLNYALHIAQLRLFQALDFLTPHFGVNDIFDRAIAYARSFSDSDQRPLRGILEVIDVPVLVIHGERDPLVPAAAAREHQRIVPQSELWMGPGRHFMVFASQPPFADELLSFLGRVDREQAVTRSEASPERTAAAAVPFDPSSVPPATGVLLVVLITLIAVATLISEDLACVGAGLLAARGQLSFVAATSGAFVGILVGDLALFAAGRILGRAAVRRRPLRWMFSETSLARASRWFQQRGMAAIFISRFLPGMRLPTYFAAGVVGTSLPLFALWFAFAGLVWTPVLVGASMVLGEQMLESVTWLQDHTWSAIAAVMGLMMIVLKVGIPACSHRGRRQLFGLWRRWTRWEFWPPWLFYPPVAVYVGWLALKHGGLRPVTAVNPGIPAGGFVGESKADIYQQLSSRRQFLAATLLIPGDAPLAARLSLADDFLEQEQCSFPVVLKPDTGQRGQDVVFVASRENVHHHLATHTTDLLIQERLDGVEFGVFYYRHPDEENGHVFSITEKSLPALTGDGVRSVEQLIFDDDRACTMSRVSCENLSARLDDIPELGESVSLAQLGTHCQGAIFLNGDRLKTAQLEASIDHIAKGFHGFNFGRFDLRAPSAEALMAGNGLRIIELNGLTSEATHIYDPSTPLFTAWAVLFEQWRLAFQIGKRQQQLGMPTTSALGLALMAWRFYAAPRKDS
ncbi:MAG: pimeloyl-ACP methyl ester carboxylesterase/membrane protein DedA with SNARE-associated domain [Pseudohongiellaceae bacterium]|jgi:pimeloyl-ACP methyl ester carboxylesterase/membrane protein DedA with SNARE-associated domain